MTAWRRTSLLIIAIALLVVAGIWVMAELRVRDERAAAIERGRALAAQISQGAEAAIHRAFLQADALLASLPGLAGTVAAEGGLTGPTMGTLLRELAHQSFSARDLVLYDPGGAMLNAALATSRRRPPTIDPAFWREMIAGGEDALQISRPMRNPFTGEYSIWTGRVVQFPGYGRVIAAAEVPVQSLGALLGSSLPGVSARVTLERDDGMLLATAPHDEQRIGAVLAAAGPDGRTDGVAEVRDSRLIGAPAIIASRVVANRDLVVRTIMPVTAALAAWQEARDGAYASALGRAALALAIAAALILHLRHRDRAELALSSARQQLQDAIDSMADGFILCDAEDRFVTCNRRYLELFPYLRPVAVRGTPFATFAEIASRIVLPDGSEEERRAWAAWRMERHLAGGGETEQRLPDGRIIQTIEWRTPGGLMASTFRDITHSRVQEQALRRAKEDAEAASRTKSSFLAHMSHELRTPLNAVLGFAEIIRDRVFGPTAADRYSEYAGDIHSSAQHLLDVINDILDLSRVEAGGLTPAIEPVAVDELVDACFAMVRPAADRGKVRLEAEAAPVVVQSDERLLRQVLLNLLSNAIKFTPADGRVVVCVRHSQNRLSVAVSDTGIGIPEHAKARLFEPFQRGDASVARRFGGTGLGLAIVQRYVQAMGGSVRIESTVGIGTTVTIDIPAPLAASRTLLDSAA